MSHFEKVKSKARETVLYGTIMVDTCHGTCVQTHRVHTTKSDHWCKLWASGDADVFVQVH